MLSDDSSRFRAPARVTPTCDVWVCDRDAYSVIEMYGGSHQMCAEHWCRFYLVTLLFTGDTHAREKWQAMVDAVGAEVGYGAGGILGVGRGSLPVTVVSRPDEWRCNECGNGLTQGPRAHYHHRCTPASRAVCSVHHTNDCGCVRTASEGARIAQKNHDAAAEIASAAGESGGAV